MIKSSPADKMSRLALPAALALALTDTPHQVERPAHTGDVQINVLTCEGEVVTTIQLETVVGTRVSIFTDQNGCESGEIQAENSIPKNEMDGGFEYLQLPVNSERSQERPDGTEACMNEVNPMARMACLTEACSNDQHEQ